MRVAIYIRVSTNQQEEKGMSLESQREGCLQLAYELGAKPENIKEYLDVTTGTKGDRNRDERKIRPQYRKMGIAIDEGQFDYVIAHSSDRLSRDQNHLVFMLDRIREAGAEFRFVAEDSDPSNAGFLIQYIRGYANSLEHERIRERSLRGKEAKLRAGRQFAQSTPFGYRWEGPLKDRLVPDEVNARIVRRMFQDVANGVSMRKVAQSLTEEGVQTRRGKTNWNGTSVRVILMNRVYDTGARTFFREGRSVSGIDEFIFENACEPLVSKEIAAMARHRIETNQQASTRNNPHPELSLLRGGFVVCEGCGKVLSVKNGKKWGPTYVTQCCKPNRTIMVTLADEAAWGVIKQLVEHPDIIRQALAQAKDPTANDLESIDKQLKQYNSRYDKMMNLATLTDDPDVAQDFVTQATMLKKSIKALERDRVEMLKAKETWDSTQTQLMDLTKWTEKMRRNLDRLTYEEKRSLLTAFDLKVHLSTAGPFKGRTTREETLARIRISVGLDELLENAIANTRCLTYHRNRRFSWTAHGLELMAGKEPNEREQIAA